MKTTYIDTKLRTLDGETDKRFRIFLNDNEGENEIKEYINALRTTLSREDRDFQKLTVVAAHSVKDTYEHYNIDPFKEEQQKE